MQSPKMGSKCFFHHITYESSKRALGMLLTSHSSSTGQDRGEKLTLPLDSTAQELSIDMLHYIFYFLHLSSVTFLMSK